MDARGDVASVGGSEDDGGIGAVWSFVRDSNTGAWRQKGGCVITGGGGWEISR